MLGTREILGLLIFGTRGLRFLKRALISGINFRTNYSFQTWAFRPFSLILQRAGYLFSQNARCNNNDEKEVIFCLVILLLKLEINLGLKIILRAV